MTTKVNRTEVRVKIKTRNKKDKLTKGQEEVLDELIESSKAWGVQQEYGNGKAVDNAEKQFNEAVEAMRKLLSKQNTRIRKLRERGDSPNPLISRRRTI